MAWDTSLARSVSFTVRVSGTVRPHEPGSITWAQDITSDLPTAVTAGGQVSHRSGSVTWARQQVVETRTPSPWYQGGYWIPEVGNPVTIDVHDGIGNSHRVFTGLIDTVEGDAFGTRTSRLVADIKGGDQVVRYQALTRNGSPVAAPEGNGEIRRQATTAVWLINEIARTLGYHSTPPAPADSKVILSAPLQGSTYNYFQSTPNGEMVVSHRPGNTSLAPTWSYGPDGFGIANAQLEWVPRTGNGTGASNLGIALLAYASHTEDALVTVTHGTTGYTYLRILGNGSVRVSTNVNGTTYAHVPAATFPAGDGPNRVSVTFRADQARTLINGVEQNATGLPTPTGAVTRIKLDAGAGSCVAGLQVWHPSELADHPNRTWTPSAHFRYGTGTYSTVCTPSVRDRRGRDVLEEYAAALLSPLWVDADGVLQVITGKGLHDQAPSLTMDALKDVSAMGYSMAMLDHRPTVELSYEHAHHTNPTATSAKTLVWQGSGISIDPSTPDETFVEVPEDEEWLMLSDPASMSQYLWPNGDVAAFNSRVGSWWGFRYENTSDTQFMSTQVSQIVETLTPWSWKITSTTTDPDGVKALTPEQYGTIPAALRDIDLPIIRARSRVKYEPRTVSATTTGATYPGTLRHDTGKWVTTTQAATDLAQWVHSMISQATPVLENLIVRFNPEIDVGKKVKIRAKDVFGVDFESLILSVEHRPSDDTTTVTARVTKITAYTDTLDDVDYAHIGQSLAQWDQARAGRTLNDVAANPYL